MGYSGGLTYLAVRLAITVTVVLTCCCRAVSVPVNTSQEALEEEVVDLRRNLSEVWQILGDYQSRLEKLEALTGATGERCVDGAGSDHLAPEELEPASPLTDRETGERQWKESEPEEEPEDDEEGGDDDDDDRSKDRDHDRKGHRQRQSQRHHDEDDRGSSSSRGQKESTRSSSTGSQRSDRRPERTGSEWQSSRGDRQHHHHHHDHDCDHDHQQHPRNRNTNRGAAGSGCVNAGTLKQGQGYRSRHGGQQREKLNVTAYCSMRPNKATPPEKRVDIRGKVYLSQENGTTLTMNIKVTGFKKPDNQSTEVHHGFHVHEFGNMTNGCESAGAHYNPFNATHGASPANTTDTSTRHLGDFGNIASDEHGNVNETLIFEMENALDGPHSLIGKTLVIHEKIDDLGTKPDDPNSIVNGNAGPRLACCIIYKLH